MRALEAAPGDSPPAPKWTLSRHLRDEAHRLRRQGRPTHEARPLRPPPSEAPPMPCDHGRRFDDREALRPPRPPTGDHDAKRAVDRPEPRPRSRPTKNRELLAEHEVRRNEARTTPQRGAQRACRMASIAARFAPAAVPVTRESLRPTRYAGCWPHMRRLPRKPPKMHFSSPQRVSRSVSP
jgi:hypothetical protein